MTRVVFAGCVLMLISSCGHVSPPSSRTQTASASQPVTPVWPEPRTLAVGMGHACALDAHGTPWCWALTEGRGLLSATPTEYDVPVPWVTLLARHDTYCGVSATGAVYCVFPTSSRMPVHMQELGVARHVVPGDISVCAVDPNGALHCCYHRASGDVFTCGEPHSCEFEGAFAGGDRATVWSTAGEIARITVGGCPHFSFTSRGARIDGMPSAAPPAGVRACQMGLAPAIEAAICREDGVLVAGGHVVDEPCQELRAGASGLCVRGGPESPWRCVDVYNPRDFPAGGRLPPRGWYELPGDVDDVAVEYHGCYRQGEAVTCWTFGGEGDNFTVEGGVEQRVLWRGRIGGEVGSASPTDSIAEEH